MECGEKVEIPNPIAGLPFDQTDLWEVEGDVAKCLRDPHGSGRCLWHTRQRIGRSVYVKAREEADGPERLDGAYLRDINLSGTEIEFRGCTLVKATFDGVTLTDKVEFTSDGGYRCVLEDATFTETNFRSAVFEDAILSYATLKPSGLILSTDFSGALLRGTEFHNTSFENCQFVNVTAEGSEFRDAEFVDTTLAGGNFERADFSGATLSGEELTIDRVILDEAELIDTTLSKLTFRETEDVRGADLSKATIRGVRFEETSCPTQFEGAKIENTEFTEATFETTSDFSQAVVLRSEFDGVEFEEGARFDHLLHDVEFVDCTMSDSDSESPVSFAGGRLHDVLVQDPDSFVVNASGAEARNWDSPDSLDIDTSDIEPAKWDNPEGAPLRLVDITAGDETTFESAELRSCTFEDSDFEGTTFRDATLLNSTVERCEFKSAEFGNADLRGVSGHRLSLSHTDFNGAEVSSRTHLTETELEPSREAKSEDVVNSDWRLLSTPVVSFTHCIVEWLYPAREEASESYRLAARQYATLQTLYADGGVPGRAADCYFDSREAARRAACAESKWRRGFKLSISRLLHGHGVRRSQVIYNLLGIWLVWTIFYWHLPLAPKGDNGGVLCTERGPSLLDILPCESTLVDKVVESLYFSAITLASVGYGDIYPAETLGEVASGLQGLLGAFLIVLLGYVFGNKDSW